MPRKHYAARFPLGIPSFGDIQKVGHVFLRQVQRRPAISDFVRGQQSRRRAQRRAHPIIGFATQNPIPTRFTFQQAQIGKRNIVTTAIVFDLHLITFNDFRDFSLAAVGAFSWKEPHDAPQGDPKKFTLKMDIQDGDGRNVSIIIGKFQFEE